MKSKGFDFLKQKKEAALPEAEVILKKYRRFKAVSVIIILVLASLLGFVLYSNLNYIIFKYLIADHYIYEQTLDELYSVHLNENDVKNYKARFDELVISVVTEKIRGTNNDRYTYLYTPAQYKLEEETEKAIAMEAEYTHMTKDTVYLKIPNVSKYTKDFIKTNKEELNKYKNIIIDLQSNYGGDLDALYEIADLFLDKGATIGYEQAQTSFFSKEIKAKNKKYFDFEKIVLLQNGETASSAEGFIVSLRENLDNVCVVGTQSFGKGIGQITLPLKNGYAVRATVLLLKTPDGNSIHKIGITPDIIYEESDIVEYSLNDVLAK